MTETVVRDHHTGGLFDSFRTLQTFRRRFDSPDEGAHSVPPGDLEGNPPVYRAMDLSRSNRPLLADTTVDELRRLYGQHETVVGVARAIDRDCSVVRNALNRFGIREPRMRLNRELEEAEVEPALPAEGGERA